MAILRQGDPRIGCLAVPMTAVAGFIVVTLVVAAVGAGASTATIAGLVGAVLGAVIATMVLRRGRP